MEGDAISQDKLLKKYFSNLNSEQPWQVMKSLLSLVSYKK